MSNIDKQTLGEDESVKTYYIHPAAFGSTKNPGYGHVAVVRAEDFEKLRTKLEAAENLAKQQGNIAVGLFDEVTTLRRNADDKAPELRSQLEEAEKRIAELESRTVTLPLPRRKIATDYVEDVFEPCDLAAVYNACRLECEVKFKNALADAGVKVAAAGKGE